MSPRLSDDQVDFSANINIYKDNQLIATIDSSDFIWTAYYEPFANDYYLRGPEYSLNAAPGNYLIKISNSINRGNYILVIGKNTNYSWGGFLHTLIALPHIKEKFFGKIGGKPIAVLPV